MHRGPLAGALAALLAVAAPATPVQEASLADVASAAAAARAADRLDEAIRLYRQGVERQPAWDEGWWYLATLLYEADRYVEALPAFVRFLALKPEAGPAWVLRGLCEFQLGEYAASLEHLGRGLGLGVGDRPEIVRVARFHQAMLLVRGGQFELALHPLTLIARTEAESDGLVDTVGLMLLRRTQLPGDVPAGSRDLVRMAGRAGYLHLARRGAEAQRAFEALVGAYPAQPWVHYAHGVFLLTAEPDRGLAALRRETELQPDAVFPHLEIAFELLRRADHAGALAAAERAVALAPGLFAAHNALGRALVELGEVARGITALEEAARLAPDSPAMHFSLARAYARAGRKEDADRERAIFSELERQRRAARGDHADEKP